MAAISSEGVESGQMRIMSQARQSFLNFKIEKNIYVCINVHIYCVYVFWVFFKELQVLFYPFKHRCAPFANHPEQDP